MFSTQEYQLIKDLTISYYNQGYKNYLCYTNNPTNSYNTQYYDVYCYYSKSDITQKDLTFTISTDTKKCLIDTKSSTSSYKNSTMQCTDVTNDTVTVDTKEFIYSNVGYNSNIIADYENAKSFYSNINYYFPSVLILVLVLYFYLFLSKIFKV